MSRHGAPDWYLYRIDEITYPVLDLAELAARLGCPSTFDRSGDILWFDDFEHGLRSWSIAYGGTGSAVTASPEQAKFGAYSIKLVTGDAEGDSAEIYKYFAFPQLSKIGLEVSFTIDTNIDYVDIQFGIHDSTSLRAGLLQYDPSAQTIKYFDDTAGIKTLATSVSLTTTTGLFHTIKLVVDFTTSYYHRLVLDNYTYDMSAIETFEEEGAGGPYLYGIFKILGTGISNGTSYIDGWIVTRDEP